MAYGFGRLRELRHLRLIGSSRADQRVPVFTFVMTGMDANAVASRLDERGIAVRAGDLAALPLLKRFGVTEAVRASAYLYSSVSDLDRLAKALQSMAGR